MYIEIYIYIYICIYSRRYRYTYIWIYRERGVVFSQWFIQLKFIMLFDCFP